MTAISGERKNAERGPKINMIYLSYIPKKRRRRIASSIRFWAPKSKFYDYCCCCCVRHTLIIVFCVRSIKISISTFRQHGQHWCFGAHCFFFVSSSGRLFVFEIKCVSVCFPAVSFAMDFWHGSKRLKIYCWVLEMRHLWCWTNKRQNPSWWRREEEEE